MRLVEPAPAVVPVSQAEEGILHVGLAKTGSTAIQQALRRASASLLDRGTLYPDVDHNHLQSLFAQNPHSLIQVARLQLADPEAERSYIESFRQALECAIADQRPRRIVFSSEYVPAMSEAEIGQLANYLRSLAPKLRVLVYIRDPWSFSVAMAQQDIRDGLRLPGPLGYHGDMRPYLNRLECGFGQRAEVRLYCDDVVADFAEWVGHELPLDMERSNTAIGLEPACILATLNELYPQVVDGVYRQDGVRDWMVEMLCDAFPEASPIRLSHKTAESIRDEALEDLRVISERYFNGRLIFEDAFERQIFIDGPDEISLERLSKADLAKGLFEALRLMGMRGEYNRDRACALQERLALIRILAQHASS